MTDVKWFTANGEPLQVDPSGEDWLTAGGEDVLANDLYQWVTANGEGLGGLPATWSGTADNFFYGYLNGNSLETSHMTGDSSLYEQTYDSSTIEVTGSGNVSAVAGFNSDGNDGPYPAEDQGDNSGAWIAWELLDESGSIIANSSSTYVSQVTVFERGENRSSRGDEPPTDGDGNEWYELEYDDSSWDTAPLDVRTSFPPDIDWTSDVKGYWNSAGETTTKHVDELYTRAYFDVA